MRNVLPFRPSGLPLPVSLIAPLLDVECAARRARMLINCVNGGDAYPSGRYGASDLPRLVAEVKAAAQALPLMSKGGAA